METATGVSLSWLESKLVESCDFVETYRPLLDAHMVDFITLNLWSTCVPQSLGEEVLRLTNEEWFSLLQQRQLNLSISDSGYHHENVSLFDYVNHCLKLSLPNIGACTKITTVLQRHGYTPFEQLHFDKFTSEKKMHEIQQMAAIINSLAHRHGINNIVDIGSGKGYLGSFLALHYQLQVVGIDSSSTNTYGATKQNTRLKKSWMSFERRAGQQDVETTEEDVSQLKVSQRKAWPPKECLKNKREISKRDSTRCENEDSKKTCVLDHRMTTKATEVYDENTSDPMAQDLFDEKGSGNFTPLTKFIQFSTNIDELLEDAVGSSASNYTNILVGLHTCGDLTPVMMKIFSSNQLCQILCNVSCCYNLMEEKFCRNVGWKQGNSVPEGFGFPLSRPLQDRKFALGQNARMLACKSLDRIASAQATTQSGLFYRALLQVFLKDKGVELLPEQHVGRIAAKCSNFCDYVRKAVLRLNIDTIQVDESELQKYVLKYNEYAQKLEAFFYIRTMLAPVIEGLILLDRLYFLIENNPQAASYLVQVFDPVISPRCYAFVSVKK